MHAEFPATTVLLLQLVVETMIDAISIRKKSLNEALTIQKPYRNHVDPIEKSSNESVFKLLLNLAHAGPLLAWKFLQDAENIETDDEKCFTDFAREF